MSKLCLMAGECGEYELLFSVHRAVRKIFEAAAMEEGVVLYRLGEVTGEQTIKVLQDGKILDFSDFDISARSFHSINDYLEKLENYFT
jgi:thiamine-monophosphate kinase